MERITVTFDYDYIEDKYGNTNDKAQSLIKEAVKSFHDGPLTVDKWGYDYVIFTGEGDRAELQALIEDKFKSRLKVNSLDGVILDIQFWLNNSDIVALSEAEGWPEELRSILMQNNERIIDEMTKQNADQDDKD